MTGPHPLSGFDTGYEAKFDFPARTALPQTRYILATVPRTGSSWLSHLLWQTGCLGAPLEYLNFLPGSPYGHAHDDKAAQVALFENALRTRTSQNGVFGVKTFPVQLEQLMGRNPQMLDGVMRVMLGPESPRKVVQLKRRDAVAHAISFARAALSGRWRAEQESGDDTEPEFSADTLTDARAEIERQERRWEQMFGDLGIEPLIVHYEDVVADAGAVVSSVADYLAVGLDPDAQVEIPEVRRQSQDGAKVWQDRIDGDGAG